MIRSAVADMNGLNDDPVLWDVDTAQRFCLCGRIIQERSTNDEFHHLSGAVLDISIRNSGALEFPIKRPRYALILDGTELRLQLLQLPDGVKVHSHLLAKSHGARSRRIHD